MIRLHIAVWLFNVLVPKVTFEQKTLDGVSGHDAKRIACLLAYWLAAGDPSPQDLETILNRKRGYITLAKMWCDRHWSFGNDDDIEIPLEELFNVEGYADDFCIRGRA